MIGDVIHSTCVEMYIALFVEDVDARERHYANRKYKWRRLCQMTFKLRHIL